MEFNNLKFRQEILKLGVVSVDQQDSIWSISKKCARTIGLPMGVGAGLATAKAGTVTVPGVGTVSAGLAGFLAGFASGTAMCTALNSVYRDELLDLIGENPKGF